MTSLSEAMRQVDYSDLPLLRSFTGRDGAALSYRTYPHAGERVVVLIHGSSGESTGMHTLARAVAGAGFAVYVPEIRGHGSDGRLGDIDYAGQLDDDLEDLMKAVRDDHPRASFTLVGHSSRRGAGPLGADLLLRPATELLRSSRRSRPAGRGARAPHIAGGRDGRGVLCRALRPVAVPAPAGHLHRGAARRGPHGDHRPTRAIAAVVAALESP